MREWLFFYLLLTEHVRRVTFISYDYILSLGLYMKTVFFLCGKSVNFGLGQFAHSTLYLLYMGVGSGY